MIDSKCGGRWWWRSSSVSHLATRGFLLGLLVVQAGCAARTSDLAETRTARERLALHSECSSTSDCKPRATCFEWHDDVERERHTCEIPCGFVTECEAGYVCSGGEITGTPIGVCAPKGYPPPSWRGPDATGGGCDGGSEGDAERVYR